MALLSWDNMQNIKEKVQQDINLRKYSELINRIAKVEYRSVSTLHFIEYDELVNIGYQTINILHDEKGLVAYNESYLTTAIKWAIRNELRSRYRWYGVKYCETRAELSENEQNELKEVIYKSVLSTDKMYDSEKTFEVKDSRKNPEEKCEFSMLSSSIKTAVMSLPKRERDLIESKFFKEKKLHEMSDEFSISQSRISRIIKTGLDKLKDELIKNEVI